MTLFHNLRYLLPIFIFLFCVCQTTQAQDYKSSIGGRLGTYIAVSYSSYHTEGRSYEAIAGISRIANQSNFILGGNYKFHFDVIAKVPTLTWYTGVNLYVYWNDETNGKKVIFAPGGIIGMEYTLENTPVNFFLDISPSYSLNSDSDFFISANLGVRYVLSTYN